jgi:hypothetical protein
VWDSKSALREDCRPAKLGFVRSTTETCCAQRSLPIRGEFLTSTAERQAAVEFAKAAAMRPRIVGEVLNKVAADPDVEAAMFEILEIQKIIESKPALPSFLTRADYSLYYWPPRGSKKHSHSRRVCDPKPQLPNDSPKHCRYQVRRSYPTSHRRKHLHRRSRRCQSTYDDDRKSWANVAQRSDRVP